MTTKQPTPQGISALLRKAGFAQTCTKCEDGETGFNAYLSARRDGPSVPIVAVTHHDHGQYETQAAWSKHLHDAPEWLSRYAEPVSAAGWDVELRCTGDTPRLIVSALPEED